MIDDPVEPDEQCPNCGLLESQHPNVPAGCYVAWTTKCLPADVWHQLNEEAKAKATGRATELSRTAQAIAALVAGAGETGIPKDRLAPMLYMADVLAREYLGQPITDIEWTADMLVSPHPGTGTLRLRSPSGGEFAALSNAVVAEVRQRDGSWMVVRGLCGATVVIQADDLVVADLKVELAEIDLTAFPLQLRRPRWWHKLVPIGVPLL